MLMVSDLLLKQRRRAEVVFVCWFAGNPLEGIQKELTRPYGNSTKLLEFLQARGVNSRLSGVIVSGLVEDGERSDWSDFLTRGYADPRLFLWIHAFAFDSSTLTAEERQRFWIDQDPDTEPEAEAE